MSGTRHFFCKQKFLDITFFIQLFFYYILQITQKIIGFQRHYTSPRLLMLCTQKQKLEKLFIFLKKKTYFDRGKSL